MLVSNHNLSALFYEQRVVKIIKGKVIYFTVFVSFLNVWTNCTKYIVWKVSHAVENYDFTVQVAKLLQLVGQIE
jgi:hypothetical protein